MQSLPQAVSLQNRVKGGCGKDASITRQFANEDLPGLAPPPACLFLTCLDNQTVNLRGAKFGIAHKPTGAVLEGAQSLILSCAVKHNPLI